MFLVTHIRNVKYSVTEAGNLWKTGYIPAEEYLMLFGFLNLKDKSRIKVVCLLSQEEKNYACVCNIKG